MKQIILTIALILILPHALFAGGAMDHVQANVNNVLTILSDPQYKSEEGKKRQQKKLVQAGEQLFDFDEVTRRSVGNYWKDFSREQKIEFRDLFSKLLQKIYMDKIQSYDGEKVIFDKEIPLSSTKTKVNTHILWKGKEVPLDYMLRIEDKAWKVYDVIVEGVSLVKNYRSQFRSILSKNPPSVLLEQVRTKIEQPTT